MRFFSSFIPIKLYTFNKQIVWYLFCIDIWYQILLIIWNLIFIEYVWNSAYNYKYKVVIYIL